MGLQQITGNEIAVGSIAASDLASASITGDKIATGQITGNLLTANCVSGNNIVSGLALTGNVSVTGNVTVGSTIGVGGATPSTSGAGITFPASQSASSDANTLDDYEEGTFTPSFSSSGASFTYDAIYRVGRYTKVGNQVTISLWCSTNASTPTGTLTNQLKIINLPFTAGNNNNSNSCALAIGELYNVIWTASKQQATAFVVINTSEIFLFWEQSNTTSTAFVTSNLQASTYILLSGSYFI